MKWDIDLWPPNPLRGTGFSRPVWIPTIYWRRVRVVQLVMMLVWALMVVLIIADGRQGGKTMWSFAVFLMAVLLWALYPRMEFRRLKRRVVDCDHLLCFNCGYPLVGIPNDHACPECGTIFDRVAMTAAWKHWIAKRKLPEGFNK